MATKLTCVRCEAPAEIVENEVKPGCLCAAGFVAHLRATVRGESKVATGRKVA